MKKIISLFISLVITGMVVKAQTPVRNCGTMSYLQQQINADPGVQTAMDQLEKWTENWIKDNPNYDSKTAVTIPVVVHLIYSTTTQNISDSRVQEQITVLNKDFGGLNTHSMGVFSSTLKVNTNLQFCLAQRKPDGTATTGIERRQTTHGNFGAANNDKRHYTTGGLDAWDVTKYFNIWVCDLGSSLCGYSQFPYSAQGGGVNATYGSSINYLFFGLTGATSPYNLGGTATHEIGHCLNLFHIWGDDNGTCTGSDNCTDTPNQADATYGHHTGLLTDKCTTTSPGIMYMDFMDYSDDQDYCNFTPNQSARMAALFASGGPLYSLITSTGCTPPSTTSCETPSGLSAASITTTTATLSWTAVTGAASYNVHYRKTGTTTWTSTTSTTTSKAITGLTAATTYEFQVQTVCSTGTGSYSASYSYTTLGSTTCTDIYETNNTLATAKLITVNTATSAMIGTSTDVDYFKFTNTSTQKNIKITLNNLPADYDIKLYKSTGTLLATSQNGGTTAESIIYNNAPVATYYVKVYGYGGVYSSTSCYKLTANISSSTYKSVEPGELQVTETTEVFAIYPNPAKDQVKIDYNTDSESYMTVKLMDITGRVVLTNTFNAVKGLNNFLVDVSAVPSGIYIVELNSDGQKMVKKLMIDK